MYSNAALFQLNNSINISTKIVLGCNCYMNLNINRGFLHALSRNDCIVFSLVTVFNLAFVKKHRDQLKSL